MLAVYMMLTVGLRRVLYTTPSHVLMLFRMTALCPAKDCSSSLTAYSIPGQLSQTVKVLRTHALRK